MTGISRILISVFDLEQSVAFYTKKMEMSAVAQGHLSAEDCRAAYGFHSAAEYVMLKNSLQSTLLQLIAFENPPQKKSREGYHSWDLGYYDLSFRCVDIQRVHEEMVADGFEFTCAPYQYTTTWSDVTLAESVMTEMNGVPVAMINQTAHTPAFEGNFRNIPDVVLVVSDMQLADVLYEDVLGCPKGFDRWLEKGLIDPITGVEGTGYHTRMAMYRGAPSTPIIEVLEFDTPGRKMAEEGAAIAQNAGLFATSFLVSGLDLMLRRAHAAGFQTRFGPADLCLKPYGSIRTAMISRPDGTLFELFEIK